MERVLWEHQRAALNAMLKERIGQILIPTGGGKTAIQHEYLLQKMNMNDKIPTVGLLVVPTIVLGQQQLKEFFMAQFKKYGDIRGTFVSSGLPPNIPIGDGMEWPLENKTRVEELIHQLNISKQHRRDHMLISTYDSLPNALIAIRAVHGDGPIIHGILDEAHYMANSTSQHQAFDAFNANLDLFISRHFFTATPKYSHYDSEENACMNNERVYGKIIYEVKPKELILSGIISSFRIQNVNFEHSYTEEDLGDHSGDFLVKCFDTHQIDINELCMNPAYKNKIGGKILALMKGSEQTRDIMRNGFIEKMHERGVAIFTTMSHREILRQIHYPEQAPRLNVPQHIWLREMQTWCDKIENKAMLIHYNQLTTGIDVPGLTGMVSLRSTIKDRGLQNLGRTLRLLKEDRNIPFNQRIKPESIIMIPRIGTMMDLPTWFKSLRDDYGYDCRVYNDPTDIAYGIPAGQPLESLREENPKYYVIEDKLLFEMEPRSKELEEQIKRHEIDFNFVKE